MGSPLVATAVDPTVAPTITTPDDGDEVDAPSVHPGFQGLLNFIAFIRIAFATLIDGGVFVTAASIEAAGLSSSSDISASGGITAGTRLRSGGDLLVANGAAIGDGLSVGAALTAASAALTGALDVGASAHVAGNATVDGTVSGSVVVGGLVSGIQSGKHVNGSILGSNSNATFQIASFDAVLIPDSTVLTADRDWTIGVVGAGDGMSIIFQNYDTTHSITIHGIPAFDGGGGFILANAASGNVNRIEVRRAGGVLYVTSEERKP